MGKVRDEEYYRHCHQPGTKKNCFQTPGLPAERLVVLYGISWISGRGKSKFCSGGNDDNVFLGEAWHVLGLRQV